MLGAVTSPPRSLARIVPLLVIRAVPVHLISLRTIPPQSVRAHSTSRSGLCHLETCKFGIVRVFWNMDKAFTEVRNVKLCVNAFNNCYFTPLEMPSWRHDSSICSQHVWSILKTSSSYSLPVFSNRLSEETVTPARFASVFQPERSRSNSAQNFMTFMKS
jgi:hypothetical protein